MRPAGCPPRQQICRRHSQPPIQHHTHTLLLRSHGAVVCPLCSPRRPSRLPAGRSQQWAKTRAAGGASSEVSWRPLCTPDGCPSPKIPGKEAMNRGVPILATMRHLGASGKVTEVQGLCSALGDKHRDTHPPVCAKGTMQPSHTSPHRRQKVPEEGSACSRVREIHQYLTAATTIMETQHSPQRRNRSALTVPSFRIF